MGSKRTVRMAGFDEPGMRDSDLQRNPHRLFIAARGEGAKRQRAIEALADDENADEPVMCLKKARADKATRQCPYLDKIDRYAFFN